MRTTFQKLRQLRNISAFVEAYLKQYNIPTVIRFVNTYLNPHSFTHITL